jgi:hypothetical protein
MRQHLGLSFTLAGVCNERAAIVSCASVCHKSLRAEAESLIRRYNTSVPGRGKPEAMAED